MTQENIRLYCNYDNLNELEKLKKFLKKIDFYSKLLILNKDINYILYNHCNRLEGNKYDRCKEDDYYALSYAYFKLNKDNNIENDLIKRYINKQKV